MKKVSSVWFLFPSNPKICDSSTMQIVWSHSSCTIGEQGKVASLHFGECTPIRMTPINLITWQLDTAWIFALANILHKEACGLCLILNPISKDGRFGKHLNRLVDICTITISMH